MAQDSMDSKEGGFGVLPLEIIERVLSLLPVPVLCRLRSVCKTWNELLCKPSFHNLRDLNGKKEAYLFLTRYIYYNINSGHLWKHRVDPLFRRRTTFLDADSRGWYSIKADDEFRGDDFEIATVSMNDGLVCELARLPGDGGEEYALFIADPVANIRRELPALPTHSWVDDVCPTIVISVDNVARSFEVFFVVYTNRKETDMYVYKSSSSEWRGLASPPKEQGLAQAASAVVFHGILYVVFNTPRPNTVCSLLSYNLKEDVWRVLNASIPKCNCDKVPEPHIFVRDTELWMTRWYLNREHRPWEDNVLFEAANIRIIDNSSIEIGAFGQEAHDSIQYHLGESDDSESHALSFFPTRSDDWDGSYTPIIWMSNLSGKMIIQDWDSMWTDTLPAHPVGQLNEDRASQSGMHVEEGRCYTCYRAWYMNLSMRNVLAPGPVAIDPHA